MGSEADSEGAVLEIAAPLFEVLLSELGRVTYVVAAEMDTLRGEAIIGADRVARARIEGVPPGSGRLVRLEVYNSAEVLEYSGSMRLEVFGGERVQLHMVLRPVEVVFADATLERVVRRAIDKPHGGIRVNDVAGLTMLVHRGASRSIIRRLGGIEHLTRLRELSLARNQIEDVGPLSGLTRLRVLGLSTNQISDVAALVANKGLGAGDRVNLADNPLSEEARAVQIPALRERGVEVVF